VTTVQGDIANLKDLERLYETIKSELARKLKVSAAFLSDIELDRRHASDEVFQRLAEILTRFSCEERVGFRFSSRANLPESFEAKVPGRAGQVERSA
jgi:transcriptional regulator with XRE-family HTH domain